MKTNIPIAILFLIVVSNPSLGAKTYEPIPLEKWTFETYHLQYHDDWTATLAKSESSIAGYSYSPHPESITIRGYLENGRAELSSAPVRLKPFTWYEVEIEYQTPGTDESPTTLAGLYPGASRDLMDQVILPPTNGQILTSRVRLHSGASNQDYHFFLGNTGIGTTLFYGFHFREQADYETPAENLMIIDLLRFEPDPANLDLWKSAKKFTDLYGFGTTSYLHPMRASNKKIEAANPGFIVFSPTATDTEGIRMGFLKKRRFNKGLKRIIRYAETHHIPVLGICAGHQTVAEHYGAFLARLKDDESGEYLKEIGPTSLDIVKEDPIFKHLPDKDRIKLTEAHLILVGYNFEMPENLASSADFGNQIFRYDHPGGASWYTFQGHIEKDWEYACPDGSIVMNNLLTAWGFTPDRY
jgi:GMP synthase-like glutamine amidotransferase